MVLGRFYFNFQIYCALNYIACITDIGLINLTSVFHSLQSYVKAIWVKTRKLWTMDCMCV